jgi:hypothetical protein
MWSTVFPILASALAKIDWGTPASNSSSSAQERSGFVEHTQQFL